MNATDWARLVKKSRWMPLFSVKPRVTITQEGLCLDYGPGRYVAALILFILGIAALVGCWFFRAELPVFVFWLGIGIGVFLLWAALYYGFTTNRVTWRRYSPTLSIEYGLAPFSQTIELPRDSLQVELDMDKLPIGKGPAGQVVLALAQKGTVDGPRIRLAVDPSREKLVPAFNALRDVFGAGTDTGLVEVTLSDGRKSRIETSALRTASASFAATRLDIPSRDVAVFRQSGQARLFWAVFLLIGIGTSASIIPFTGDFSFDDLFPMLFGVVFGGVGLVALLNARRVVLDRKAGLLTETKGAFGWYRRTGERKLADIEAVQLCSQYVSGGEGSDYMAYQINLIFAGPGGGRMTLSSHAKEKQVRDDAQALAGFLGKPLLDHTIEDDGPKDLGQLFSRISNHWKNRRRNFQ